MLDELELSLLFACRELVEQERQMVLSISQYLNVLPGEVFYTWKLHRVKIKGSGLFNNEWKYFFHGYDCDLSNIKDGRVIRLGFGPDGRFDAFTEKSLLSFIMTAKPPWEVFDDLKDYLFEDSTISDHFSGSPVKLRGVFENLSSLGLIKRVNPELCEQFIEQKGWVNSISERFFIDMRLSCRFVISPIGWDVLSGAKSISDFQK